jgi:hypothetical protein
MSCNVIDGTPNSIRAELENDGRLILCAHGDRKDAREKLNLCTPRA